MSNWLTWKFGQKKAFHLCESFNARAGHYDSRHFFGHKSPAARVR